MRNPFEGPKLFSPSFVDALRAYAPDLLEARAPAGTMPEVPHGTTVAAVRYADGVVMGGDRRATEGMNIAQRDIEKVFPADDFSAVAIAGAAGPAIEMVRLFQTELEHYEKIEGSPLSLEGKANKLGQMVRGNLPLAMQGLVVLPLFCGYDPRRQAGRIFRYDVTGGRWEDADYHATGSGGKDARGSLKKRWRSDMDGAAAVDVLVEALYDAADEDAATGGPDLVRGIFPVVATVTAGGYRRIPDDELRKAAERLVAARAQGEG
ncbi:MAG TPA: proteasome subunit beta [Actinomycetota bacterium]|nr:proteasome subunit beta [Actinomycetota bacterium]